MTLFFYGCSNVHYIKNYKKTITKQSGKNTCWAASISGVLKYFGRHITEKEVISLMYDKDSDLPWMPNSYRFEYPNQNYKDYFFDDVIPILGVKGQVIEKKDVEKYIDKNTPVIVGFNSHIQIIIGYNESDYILMNPFFGKIEFYPKRDIVYSYIGIQNIWSPIFFVLE